VGYQNRLDLLAHSILFLTIAPCSFILKTIGARYLEWPYLHGRPNTTKTKTGELVLSADGHQNDHDYNVNMAHIDTTPRFGDTISKTTFPVVVNEVDFTDNKTLRNNVKSAVDQPKFRKVLDTSRRAEYVPALSTFFLTGNPPPPFDDPALMKRLAARYHSQTETHFRNEQAAKDFDALLSLEGYKLQALGLFRNKYIMEHQELILDKRLEPFEKAKKIVIAAYEAAEMVAPCWLLTKQLEQNQLEESIEDNNVIIKRAFETYIDINFRNALTFWQRTEASEDKALPLPKETSSRLVKLVDSNLLADIKRARNNDIIIRKGILVELYKYGLTNEQLPNLSALHHCISGSKYRKVNGHWVVDCTGGQFADYFDSVDMVDGNGANSNNVI
jgi:hypothetical protein